MQEYEFWWDDDNIDHMADHGVEPYEAEEVITNRLWLQRGGEGKYLAYGQRMLDGFWWLSLPQKLMSVYAW